MSTMYINGKEITNPAAKLGITLLAVLAAAAVIVFVVPAVGLAVAIALGVALIAVTLALLVIPAAVICGPILWIILAPLRILSRVFCGRRRYYW
ncbi:MAG: hypothetical protein PHW26_04990 [Eubacteriales bacterium]|nr:hypothetical protein [Eubacteriales bacterium]MDD4658372.1 hypothetical protein [Eubacteriales bacterium]